MKVLGIWFTNSIKEMVSINWNGLVTKFAQQIFTHSRRTLTLNQKVVLLNTFICSKMWYIASILPPQNIHTAKVTSTMGSFIWRNIPARIPMIQLARSKASGGLNLHLPAFKCKALLINRHLRDIVSIPFYHSLLSENNPPPACFPCLRSLYVQQTALPAYVRESLSSRRINLHLVEETERPRVERHNENIRWRRVWTNIGSKLLPSDVRSTLYLFVNEKIEHRRLWHTTHRADSNICLHCNNAIETLTHKFSECPRVLRAWDHLQHRLTTILGGWQRLTFADLLRPVLDRTRRETKTKILLIVAKYISFVNIKPDAIDVDELNFELNCI